MKNRISLDVLLEIFLRDDVTCGDEEASRIISLFNTIHFLSSLCVLSGFFAVMVELILDRLKTAHKKRHLVKVWMGCWRITCSYLAPPHHHMGLLTYEALAKSQQSVKSKTIKVLNGTMMVLSWNTGKKVFMSDLSSKMFLLKKPLP